MICNACGATDAPSKCSRCLSVAYCNRACQSNDWRSHKKVCQPNVEVNTIEFDRATRLSQDLEHPCQKCGTNPDDLGAAAMCLSCGVFLMCGPCTTLKSTGAKNGRPSATTHICAICAKEYETKKETPRVGLCLKKLLKEKPEGRHVNYAKLMLAQVRLHDIEEFSGIPPSRKKAKQEYIRLANEENYGLAQFALASFYDPYDSLIWDGPLNLEEIIDEQPFPFPSDETLAKEYYDKAVENRCTMAIQTVGTMYKNGELYPCDKVKAAMLLIEAVEMGDPRAMCNLGQMLMKGDGIPQNLDEGMRLYVKAARDHDIWSAQFMVGQIGMMNPLYRTMGRDMVRNLAAEDWAPPNPMQDPMYEAMREFYGIDDDDE